MEDMRSRMKGGDVEAEKAAAIKVTLERSFIIEKGADFWQAMCDIAASRARKLLPASP